MIFLIKTNISFQRNKTIKSVKSMNEIKCTVKFNKMIFVKIYIYKYSSIFKTTSAGYINFKVGAIFWMIGRMYIKVISGNTIFSIVRFIFHRNCKISNSKIWTKNIWYIVLRVSFDYNKPKMFWEFGCTGFLYIFLT